jgi:hypothetical protein
MVRSDRGDVVLGWLSRVVVILAIVGVLGYDGVTIGLANGRANDQAHDAALAAAADYYVHHNVQTAYQVAVETATTADSGDVIAASTFSVSSAGAVSLRLTHSIHTVVAHYLPVATFKTATQSVVAPPTTP